MLEQYKNSEVPVPEKDQKELLDQWKALSKRQDEIFEQMMGILKGKVKLTEDEQRQYDALYLELQGVKAELEEAQKKFLAEVNANIEMAE